MKTGLRAIGTPTRSRAVLGAARRVIGRCVVATLAPVLVAFLLQPGCAPADEHPTNVVLISIDTLRADHVGSYGYPRPTTPVLDSIAEQGVRFSNAFSQSSWTLPAHASLLTSQYSHEHGAVENNTRIKDAAVLLAEALQNAGYDTGAFVTWVYVSKLYGFDRGFAHFAELIDQDNLMMAAGAGAVPAGPTTDAAIQWLEREREAPFFLFVHYFDPHMDYAPPEPFDRLYDPDYTGSATGRYKWLVPFIRYLPLYEAPIDARDRDHVEALYDAEIRYTDEQIGRLLDAVDANVGLDDCLVVIVSDHGEEFNDHLSMEGHGWTLYDEIIRVPLIVRFPDAEHAGAVIDDTVELIDVAPTILGRLGVTQPDGFRGRDLTGLIETGELSEPRPFAYAETHRFNVIRRAIRGPRYKLIQTRDTGRNAAGVPVEAGFQMFDIVKDPGEQHDIFDPSDETARRLAKFLEGFAARERAEAEEVEIPESTLELLRSLGYVH